jgi:hypothetical protein
MKNFFVVLIYFISPLFGFGQTYFNNVYDFNNEYNSGSVTILNSDGSYITIGNSFDSTSYIELRKNNSLGNSLWRKTYRNIFSSYVSYSNCAFQNIDSTILLVGNNFLAKFNQSGDTVWTKNFGNTFLDNFSNIISDNNGGYILSGQTNKFTSGANEDGFIIKIDSVGNILWEKNYSSLGVENLTSIIKTNDNGYISTGFTHDSADIVWHTFIVKTDSAGNQQWQKNITINNFDIGVSVYQTADSNFVIMGSGGGQGHILKLSNDGATILWIKDLGSTNGGINEGALLSNGDFIMVGNTNEVYLGAHGLVQTDGWIIKMNSNGDSLWTKTYIKQDLNYFTNVKQTNDGGFILTGYGKSNFDMSLDYFWDEDMWLVKVDSMGACLVTGVDVNYKSAENDLSKLFPNPNNGNMQFDYELDRGEKGELLIFNALGQFIKKYTLTEGINSLQISETTLENGIYFYQEVIKDQLTASHKFVILK